MSGQVQTTEIPHQVPEDDGVLAEELVGVDHLRRQGREVGVANEQQTSGSRVMSHSCVADIC